MVDIIQALNQYKQLISKVDEKFNEIYSAHKSDFQCGKSCYSCCKPSLTISQIETLSIKNYLKDNPQVLVENEFLDSNEYCDFLLSDGTCSIYPVRPIICRSHGAPVAFKNEDNQTQKDVCELNFKNKNLDELSNSMFYNLDTLNLILAAINKAANFEDKRIPLTRFHLMEKFALVSRVEE